MVRKIWAERWNEEVENDPIARKCRELEPGGLVLLDVYSLTAFNQREEVATYETNLLNGFWSPNKYYGFLNSFKYEEEKVVLDKYTLIEASRTRTVYNWLQYFSPEALEREFVEVGFAIDKLYSDVAGSQFGPETTELAIVSQTAISRDFLIYCVFKDFGPVM